jgi:uncharacterized protein (TIGR03000 family)
MSSHRFLFAAILGYAGLLSGPNMAQAQGYLYGYYYPETGLFLSADSPKLNWYYTEPPPWLQSYSRTRTSSFYVEPVRAAASVRVLLPDAQARVWFDGKSTNSTGTERLYQSPALTAGTYEYRVRASWMQGGQEVSQERSVSVRPGQMSVVDFTKAGPEKEQAASSKR